MCISSADAEHARSHFQVALGLVAVREPHMRDVIAAAISSPSPTTIRQVLEMSRGQRWRESVLEAMAEVGLAASAEILGGPDA